jgi:excinuclease ABC subunit C
MLSLELSEQIKKLPSGPGIYLFRNSRNKPLYIGKALNLKGRVTHYLKAEDSRLKRMIRESGKLDFIETTSDIEALIMESQYIKTYRPDFNIMLRDDKQYFYVGITKEQFPRIFLTHQPGKNSKLNSSPAEFVGPFTDGSALKTTLRHLRRIFPYCTCKQKHNNYCLNYHIGKCPGVCCLKKPTIDNLQLTNYKKNIKAIKDILNGKKETLIKDSERKMRALAKEHKFENALELQEKIEKVRRVFLNAQIIRNSNNNEEILENLKRLLDLPVFPKRIEAYDIANIQGNYAVGAMVVFVDGKPDKNEYRKFKIYSKSTADDTAMLKEIISRRFKHTEWEFPGLILIDGGKGQLNASRTVSPKGISIIALTKNEKHIGEKIFVAGKKEATPLSNLPVTIKNLLLGIDAEAHRFAITYYRLLHGKVYK